MNYPFTKKKSLGRFVSLALVLALMLATLSGCSLLPSSKNTEPSTEATEPSENIPNIVESEPSTEPSTVPTTAPTTAPKKENVAVVKEQLNLRSSPSTGSRVITSLDAGEEVEVMRIEAIGSVEWAFVDYDGLMGWIVTNMLDMSNVQLTSGSTNTPANGDSSTPTTGTTAPTTGATEPTVNNITGVGGGTTTPANAKYGVVKASELNIRSTASQTGERVGSYKYGDRITILETSNGWARTDKGWVSLSYVYVDGEVGSNSAYGTVTATQLNVRSGPGTNYDKVKSLNLNDRVQILEQIKVGNTTWGYVSGGWVSMDYISLEGSTGAITGGNTGGTTGGTGTGTGVVTGSAVNIRAGAGTSYQVVASKSAGDVVTILETATAEGYTWGRTDIGWICMNYVRMN